MGNAEMIVLDTHAWIWWVSSPERLSDTGREAIDRAMAAESLYLSCISAWEVAMLTERGRLQLTMEARDWIAKSEALSFLKFVPVNNNIAIRSVQLLAPIHPDPADRIIIATALELGAAVATKDEKIQNYPHVKSVW